MSLDVGEYSAQKFESFIHTRPKQSTEVLPLISIGIVDTPWNIRSGRFCKCGDCDAPTHTMQPEFASRLAQEKYHLSWNTVRNAGPLCSGSVGKCPTKKEQHRSA